MSPKRLSLEHEEDRNETPPPKTLEEQLRRYQLHWSAVDFDRDDPARLLVRYGRRGPKGWWPLIPAGLCLLGAAAVPFASPLDGSLNALIAGVLVVAAVACVLLWRSCVRVRLSPKGLVAAAFPPLTGPSAKRAAEADPTFPRGEKRREGRSPLRPALPHPRRSGTSADYQHPDQRRRLSGLNAADRPRQVAALLIDLRAGFADPLIPVRAPARMLTRRPSGLRPPVDSGSRGFRRYVVVFSGLRRQRPSVEFSGDAHGRKRPWHSGGQA